jgi:hypothetical protein
MGKPWDEGVPEAAAQGLVAGSGMGLGVSTTTSTVEAISAQADKELKTFEASQRQQGTIDELIEVIQSSKTNERAPERFQEFLQSAGAGNVEAVYIDPEALEGVENVPDFMYPPEDGTGSEIRIPIEKFATEVVKNEELLAAIRPHVRLHPEALSASQLESKESPVLQKLIEKAAKEKEAKTAADIIYDQVKDQIVDTRRQSPETAKFSAQIIPAYAVVKSKQLGISVDQVYKDMGLRIEGPTQTEVAPGTIMDQAPKKPRPAVVQDFGDLKSVEDVIVKETGEKVQVAQEVQKVWEDTQNRRQQIQNVMACING